MKTTKRNSPPIHAAYVAGGRKASLGDITITGGDDGKVTIDGPGGPTVLFFDRGSNSYWGDTFHKWLDDAVAHYYPKSWTAALDAALLAR